MGEPIAVHIIDDDEAQRDALSALMDAAGYSVAAYPSATAFLERLPALRSGCVVTDVQMPDMTGLELLRRLQDRVAQFPVIVLTGHADVSMAVEALKNGACDFIEKPLDSLAMLTAVRAAAQRLAGAADRGERQSDYAARLAVLTARERDVLRGLVAGWPNKTIGRELGISSRTVEGYRAKIMIKVRASSFSELVRMALVSQGVA